MGLVGSVFSVEPEGAVELGGWWQAEQSRGYLFPVDFTGYRIIWETHHVVKGASREV